MKPSGVSRRTFLKATGALAVGFSLGCARTSAEAPSPQAPLPGGLESTPRLDSWLEVAGDGSVTVFTGKLELGQGISIALAQVAAEELGVDVDRVSVTLADTALTPNEGYTAGSRSIESSAMAVRYAAAFARQRILLLASSQLGVKVEHLDLIDDQVISSVSPKTLPLREILTGESLSTEVRGPVTLKSREHYRYVGKPVGRKELETMVTGGPLFVSDLRFPKMLHARVIRPPSYGAKLMSHEPAVLQKMAGAPKAFRDGTFLAVVADSEWACMQAGEALRRTCRWSAGRRLEGSENLGGWISKAPGSSESVEKVGEKSEVFEASAEP